MIDDQESVRRSYAWLIEDLDMKPYLEPGPIVSIGDFIGKVKSVAQAAICDHRLTVSNYATCNGAEIAARLYDDRVPAVVCTSWERACLDEMRPFRRRLPVLLKPEELGDDNALYNGFESCIREFAGEYSPSRKAWRTLVRFQEVSAEDAYIVVPGWNPSEVVRILRRDLPLSLNQRIDPGYRCHALVNIGAEAQEDLYFDWREAKGK